MRCWLLIATEVTYYIQGSSDSGAVPRPETCPVPEINNIQGRLQCEPKPNARNIPPGGYQNSCKGCEIRKYLDVGRFEKI